MLRPIARLALEDYRPRVWERKGTERVLQELIDAALEYDAIDDARVLAAVGTSLELYPRYVQAIEAYLGKIGV